MNMILYIFSVLKIIYLLYYSNNKIPDTHTHSKHYACRDYELINVGYFKKNA